MSNKKNKKCILLKVDFYKTSITPHSGCFIIVEDDEDNRDFIRYAFLDLETHNELKFFKVEGEFLQYLRSKPQKLFIIITDINLPGITGLQLWE